jgi:branched-chain amino acid transport system substrate-binding protein
MLTRKAITALLAASAVTLAAAGCSGGGSENSDDTVRIGVSLPLTGEFSQPGTAALHGYETWVEEKNAAGGLLGRQIELIVKDDASNQNTVVADYNALIGQDRVDLLLGTFSSLLNLPASAVAEKNQMLYVEPAGGTPEIFERGFKYLFFTQQTTSDFQGRAFANWISSLPESERPKTVAYPTIDDPFARATVDGIKQILTEKGLSNVYETVYAVDTRNFDTIVAGMQNANPDLVVSGATFEDGVNLVRGMLRANFKPRWLYQTSAPSLGRQYAEGIGPDNTNGIMYSISHIPQADIPGNEEFVSAFEKKFGELPPEDAADAYAAGQVLAAAVEGVGRTEDQTALADWLRSNSVQTVLGELSWDDTGKPSGDYLVGQWQDGRVEVIVPEDARTSDRIIDGWQPGATP